MDRGHRTPFRIRTIQHLLRRPTQLRAWARRTPRRYGIWKVYLVSDLFYLLDITKRGVLGIDELFLLAMFTGSQGHSDELQDCIAHLLDTWGSPCEGFRGPLAPVQYDQRRSIQKNPVTLRTPAHVEVRAQKDNPLHSGI